MFLINMIDKFMKPVQAETKSKRIGVAEGKFVVPDDFDECNDEIAEMSASKNSIYKKGPANQQDLSTFFSAITESIYYSSRTAPKASSAALSPSSHP